MLVTVRPLKTSLLVIIALSSLASGCTTTCSEACDKAIDCQLDSPRTSFDACYDDCERQRSLYADWWENDEMSDRFDDHRDCISDSSCEELEEGVCYDDELFIF